MARIRFEFGTLALEAELLDTPTAAGDRGGAADPASAMTWGEEVYFEMPVTVARETDARAVVTPGEVAYLAGGHASRSASAARRSRRATRPGSPRPATCSPRRSAT